MFLALIRACECVQLVPVTWQRTTQIAWGSSVTQAICDRQLEKQAGIFVSKILFLEHVGICLAQTGGSSAEREHIQCLGGCSRWKPCLVCVSELSAPAFGWDHCCGVPVCTEGWSFQGLGDGVGLSGL